VIRVTVPPDPVDISKPSIARVYDYWLGGHDNYAADRELGDAMSRLDPGIAPRSRINREYLAAAVTRAAEAGIAQFCDLGSGLPTHPAVHESARAVQPAATVTYLDFDLLVVSHVQALLAHGLAGVAAAQADLRKPGAVLAALEPVTDFTRPACVILAAVAHVMEEEQVRGLLAAVTEPLASGSWVIFSTIYYQDAELLERIRTTYTAAVFRNHGPGAVAGFMAGLDLVDPGVTGAQRWIAGIRGCEPRTPGYVLVAAGVKP
jgi:O-methyltransferase involved in polyketide biosynthesis